jgi:hypothetical protein
MDKTFVRREQDRMLGELFEFLRIPSVSTLPSRRRLPPGGLGS